MNHPPVKDDKSRFSASVRHYHRAGGQAQRTWDEWIDGDRKPKRRIPWLKIILITLAVGALIAILIGLFIELK